MGAGALPPMKIAGIICVRDEADIIERTLENIFDQGVDHVYCQDDGSTDGTLALISRRYIEEESGCIDVEGVVIYPGYFHNYSETELFETAKSRGRFAYCEESVVEHLHPDAGKAEKDEIYQLGMAHLVEDQDLFFSRRHLWDRKSVV